MSLFAGVGCGGSRADPASAGGTGRALLELTPNKVAVCHLVQVFAPPAQAGGDVVPPFPFESVAHHNRLGLFLFTLTRPSLEELLRQLKAVDDLTNGWLCEQLTSTLSALNSPDALFNFFDKLRGEGHLMLCSTFEALQVGVCHLLADLVMYCNSTDASYDLADDEDFDIEMSHGPWMQTLCSQAGIFEKYAGIFEK